jgi:hypothetical protein
LLYQKCCHEEGLESAKFAVGLSELLLGLKKLEKENVLKKRINLFWCIRGGKISAIVIYCNISSV